ncbi:MAG: hypothetical protein ACK4GQ_05475, partial [Candidatus Hadarchaeales archaeon]
MEKIVMVSILLCTLLLFQGVAGGEISRKPVSFIKVDNSGFLVEGQVVDEETGEGIEEAIVVVRSAGKSWRAKTETKVISDGYWGEWERLGYSARTVSQDEYENWPMGWVQTSENSASDYGKCIVVDGGRKSYWVSEIRYGRKWVDNSRRDGGYFRTFVWRGYELEISARGYEKKVVKGEKTGNLGKITLRYRPFDVWLSENFIKLTKGWSSADSFLSSGWENTWKLENSRVPVSTAKAYMNSDLWSPVPVEWSASVEHYEKTGTRTETVYGWSDWEYRKTEFWNGSSYQVSAATISKSTWDSWPNGSWSSFTDKDSTKYYYWKGSSADVVKTKVTYKVYHNDWGKWKYEKTVTGWVDGYKEVGDDWYGGWFSDWHNVVTEVHDYEFGNYRYYCYRDTYTRSWESKGTKTVDVYGWVSKGTQTFTSEPKSTSEYRYSN